MPARYGLPYPIQFLLLQLPGPSALLPVRFHTLHYSTLRLPCQAPPFGGDEGIRTPDLLRAREALSHLSYIPGLAYGLLPARRWACLDLNQRPSPYQRDALAD